MIILQDRHEVGGQEILCYFICGHGIYDVISMKTKILTRGHMHNACSQVVLEEVQLRLRHLNWPPKIL